jgi:adenylate cyclase class 2
MLEVEMKFLVSDFADIENRLAKAGAVLNETRQDSDHYFNAPDRDFARTDEALRVRRTGPANFVTYKGPKQDTQTKTRTEIQVPLAEAPKAAKDFVRILIHLGYHPVGVVHKQRRIYHLKRGIFAVEICLDEVDRLGRFVELEILAPEDQRADTRRANS